MLVSSSSRGEDERGEDSGELRRVEDLDCASLRAEIEDYATRCEEEGASGEDCEMYRQLLKRYERFCEEEGA